jgi:hypothetical protein
VRSDKVAPSVKTKYKSFQCEFVWGSNYERLSELSRRTNNTNQHHWDSPEYLLHIEYARALFNKYKRPMAPKAGEKMSKADREKFKV